MGYRKGADYCLKAADLIIPHQSPDLSEAKIWLG